jgi:hypothetical protein
MSLETAIAANTTAIQQLIAVWSKLAEQTSQVSAALAEPIALPTTESPQNRGYAAIETVEEPIALPTTESPHNRGSAAIEPVVDTPTDIEYNTVSLAITTAVGVDRKKVVATLASFGASKGTELAPEDYAAFLEALAA